MKNYELETKQRTAFIRDCIASAGAAGVVYGNSGGKDSALVGILCKMACDDTVGLIMPCGSKQNYETDKADAETVAQQFAIAVRLVDLSDAKNELARALGATTQCNDAALANMAPRLRMAALYAVAASENRLVAGTGNRSEGYMGYFTKWGDGAFDFNPIADLTVSEVYEFLRHLDAPARIISKAPSGGLFDGQTDESEMGISYRSIDEFLLAGTVNEHDRAIMERFHKASEHKRNMPIAFAGHVSGSAL
ncbi:MAG: NAD(+) synthase [Deltaproteobacteria bacterium]|jgi:NAD+ synthase|nr:NAD(+) synthase [Deltaproteobacteria bacterium]